MSLFDDEHYASLVARSKNMVRVWGADLPINLFSHIVPEYRVPKNMREKNRIMHQKARTHGHKLIREYNGSGDYDLHSFYRDASRAFHTNPVVQYVHGKIDSVGSSIDERVDNFLSSLTSKTSRY